MKKTVKKKLAKKRGTPKKKLAKKKPTLKKAAVKTKVLGKKTISARFARVRCRRMMFPASIWIKSNEPDPHTIHNFAIFTENQGLRAASYSSKSLIFLVCLH